jgi:hypothetical protein
MRRAGGVALLISSTLAFFLASAWLLLKVRACQLK